MGASLRGAIGESGLGFVADLGIAGDFDYFNIDYTDSYETRYEETFMNISMGLGLGAGLQFRIPVGPGSIIAELGASFNYYFFSYSSLDQYETPSGGTRTHTFSGEGDFNPIGAFRFAPHLLIGWNF